MLINHLKILISSNLSINSEVPHPIPSPQGEWRFIIKKGIG